MSECATGAEEAVNSVKIDPNADPLICGCESRESTNRSMSIAGRVGVSRTWFFSSLLEEALMCARDRRRIIFFCACEFPRFCHRKYGRVR